MVVFLRGGSFKDVVFGGSRFAEGRLGFSLDLLRLDI